MLSPSEQAQALKKDIYKLQQQLTNADINTVQYINLLNNLILIQYQISDKPITYSTSYRAYASWNMGCGAFWVDNIPQVQFANKKAKQDIRRRSACHPNEAHRLTLCMIILDAIAHDATGISNILIQEGPSQDAHRFYLPNESRARFIRNASPQSQSCCNYLCIIGRQQRDGTPARQQDRRDSRLLALQQLAQQYELNSGEFQLGTANNGEIVVNIHFHYGSMYQKDGMTPSQGLVDRKNFLIKAAQIHGVIIMGDSNINYPDWDKQETTIGLRHTVGGAATLDVIMGVLIKPNNQIFPPNPDWYQAMKNSATTLTTQVEGQTSSTSSATGNYQLSKLLGLLSSWLQPNRPTDPLTILLRQHDHFQAFRPGPGGRMDSIIFDDKDAAQQFLDVLKCHHIVGIHKKIFDDPSQHTWSIPLGKNEMALLQEYAESCPSLRGTQY